MFRSKKSSYFKYISVLKISLTLTHVSIFMYYLTYIYIYIYIYTSGLAHVGLYLRVQAHFIRMFTGKFFEFLLLKSPI